MELNGPLQSTRLDPLAAPSLPQMEPDLPRVLGRCGDAEGPVLVCIAGLHGNEPTGVIALSSILRKLKESGLRVDGQFWGLAGNRGALSRGVRFETEDLNRMWTRERIQELRSASDQTLLHTEDVEQYELLQLVDQILSNARYEAYFLDLHTTSAESGPFAIIGDTLRNRDFALNFPVPIILGLEEQIEGALLEHIGSRGAITVGFEAGEHRSTLSIERHEAVIWVALVASGLLKPSDCPPLSDYRRKLENPSLGLPRFLEVRYRHPVTPGDSYETLPGFLNFQNIKKGERVAHDVRGPVESPENGLLLMPLYQRQGTDGFFVVRRVHSFWLTLSRFLRRLQLERLLPLLPGIRKHPTLDDALVVNRRVARWRVLELSHLLGYRKRRIEQDRIVVIRRRHDMRSPFSLSRAGRK